MAFTIIDDHLRELTFIFGMLGNVISFGVYLAPLPTFWRIFKRKSTLLYPSIPYSVALFSAVLLLYYAFIKENNGTMIIAINTIGSAIEISYLIIYLLYAPKKAKVYTAKSLGLFNVGFFGLIVLTTMVFFRGTDPHTRLSKGGMREKVVGWICGIFSVCVFAAPLTIMRTVIKTKSVEYMPFWLSFSLTLCGIMWLFYGLLIKDFYIAVPNVLGFVFGVIQMILHVIYKDSSKKKHNKSKGDDLVVQAVQVTDATQFQELVIDMKLGNFDDEKVDQTLEHQKFLRRTTSALTSAPTKLTSRSTL